MVLTELNAYFNENISNLICCLIPETVPEHLINLVAIGTRHSDLLQSTINTQPGCCPLEPNHRGHAPLAAPSQQNSSVSEEMQDTSNSDFSSELPTGQAGFFKLRCSQGLFLPAPLPSLSPATLPFTTPRLPHQQ